MTDQQRKHELIAQLTDPSYRKMQARQAKEQKQKLIENDKNEVGKLIVSIDMATDEDYAVLSDQTNKVPAMSRFNLIPTIDKTLKKKNNQTTFLECNGLSVLEKWLHKNPDGSYPC